MTGCQNTKECGNDVTRRKDDEKCGNPAGDLGCGGNLVGNGKGNPIAGSLESAILCVV